MSYTVQHELKGHVAKPVPWWIVIAILIIAAAFVIGLASYISYHLGYASAERPIVLTKTCPAPAQYTAWNCSSSELREYRNVCLRRSKGAHQ